MVTILITVGILSLASLVFKLFWKAIINWCKNIFRAAVGVIKGVITLTRQVGKVGKFLYRRWKNGKITKTPITTEEEVDITDVPKDIANALGISDEVIVCDDVGDALE